MATPYPDRVEMTVEANASTFRDLSSVINEQDIMVHTRYIWEYMIP